MINITCVLTSEQARNFNPYNEVMNYTKERDGILITFFCNLDNSFYEFFWVGLN
jgi:hypothetical protein